MQIRAHEIESFLFQSTINIIKRKLRNAPEFTHNLFLLLKIKRSLAVHVQRVYLEHNRIFLLQNSFNSEGPDALLFLAMLSTELCIFSDSKRSLGIFMQYTSHTLTFFSSL
ncbi:hypothetical protein P618_200570 [Holospora obtusa F1]|uniref:Uncharacterized protein n=1 Tax=Holospora obtusa F1 TaxID=1399147 RepID=W6TE83_HOLOB|nr:hypothetical protein P618_200570 [Holospora obtusa F1]